MQWVNTSGVTVTKASFWNSTCISTQYTILDSSQKLIIILGHVATIYFCCNFKKQEQISFSFSASLIFYNTQTYLHSLVCGNIFLFELEIKKSFKAARFTFISALSHLGLRVLRLSSYFSDWMREVKLKNFREKEKWAGVPSLHICWCFGVCPRC